LWKYFGAAMPFYVSAGIAFVSAMLLLVPAMPKPIVNGETSGA
jgi:hypothetical protein